MPKIQRDGRLSRSLRGYDRAWYRLRARFLAEHPLCECDQCKATGAVVAADVVDHIIAIEERPDLRLAWDNLRAMSKPHHDAHTVAQQGFNRGKQEHTRLAVGADGVPIDARHPWSKGRGVGKS